VARSRLRRRPSLSRVLSRAAAFVILLFLVAPLVVLIGSSFSATASVSFPPSGFSLRWYEYVFTSAQWRDSFLASGLLVLLVVPTVATLAALGGYAVVRGTFPGRGAVSAFLLSPLLIPEVMIGLGLLSSLQPLGIRGTVASMWIAHSLVCLPFAMRSVIIAVSGTDPRVELAAASLGASRVRVFLTVSLPMMAPGIVSGAVLATVVSLGEVAVSAFVSGPTTTTIPLRIFSAVQYQLDPSAAAASTILIVLSATAMVLLDRFSKVRIA